MAYNFNLMN